MDLKKDSFALHVINLLVFITVVESVYSAHGLIPYIKQIAFRP
jgi:hypothetical protein